MPPSLEEPRTQSWQSEPGAQRLRELVEQAVPGAQIVRVVPLKADAAGSDENVKGGGYGAPLRLDISHEGQSKSFVLHTVTSNQFGHDRRADRAAELLLAADTFAGIPRHVAVLDVGAYRGSESFVSLAGTGEFYLLTTHAEGRVYAEDLRRLASTGRLLPMDLERQRVLVDYLAKLHAKRVPDAKAAYERAIRDTLGSGEGIFGIVDDYPDDVPAAGRARLERIESQCLEWRFRLKRKHERHSKIHGDFHPFNVLFDERSELSVLDASRGCVGDPADDVTCMAINYAFFSLGHPGAWRSALRTMWHEFWESYRALSQDAELDRVVAPYFAWRGLVLASPAWYPELRAEDRDRVLGFVERVLSAERFVPTFADEFFDS